MYKLIYIYVYYSIVKGSFVNEEWRDGPNHLFHSAFIVSRAIKLSKSSHVFCFSFLLAVGSSKPKSNRKAMNRNWSNQKANPALKTKAGNK